MRLPGLLAVALALILATTPAFAQRAGETAVSKADDAFGTSIGNESIGLYGAYDARGFSPAQAGNVRIEGLYFDQQAGLNGRITAGSAVRVGISAQAYPFPAPTGIADFQLRKPGDVPLTSVYVGLGVFKSVNAQIDTQIPVIADRLGVGVGGQFSHNENEPRTTNQNWQLGFIGRARPSDDSEIIGFWSRNQGNCCKAQPVVFTGGPYFPPPFPKRYYWGQDWTGGSGHNQNFGLIGRMMLADWTVRGGIFRSSGTNGIGFADFLTDVQSDGSGHHIIIGFPARDFGSTSGEVRLTRVLAEGGRFHTINLAFRGRDVKRMFGGTEVKDLGAALLGVRAPLPMPSFTFGPLSNDHARQGTVGIAYGALWPNIGEVGIGVQKTFYHRDLAQPTFPLATTSASPFLYNATASLFFTKSLAAYAGYTRGLEESGSAPNSAANRGEAMPPAITQQVDAGLRWAITPRFKLVAGVFQVQKPYFNINTANVFGALGTVRHRGAEFSVSGTPVDSVTVVAGLTVLQPRISGEPVDRGIIGPIPPGPRPRKGFVNVTYQPPALAGLSLDAQVYHFSSKTVRSDNLLSAPGWNEVTLGARYKFTVAGSNASVRIQANNVGNTVGVDGDGSGAFFPRFGRTFSGNFAMDF